MDSIKQLAQKITSATPLLIFVSLFMFIAFAWFFTFRATHARSSNGTLICDICNKKITGKYYETEAGTFHKACFDKSPKCGYCGQPVIKGQGIKSRGKIYHYGCLKNLKRCALCNELISGRYITSGDRAFHKECFDKLPKCMYCNGPVLDNEKVIIAGQACHKECAKNVLICDVCGEMIKGVYLIDAYGRKCCSKHSEKNRCFVCNYTGPVIDLGDSRHICKMCLRSAVVKKAKALKIFKKVKKIVAQNYGIKVKHDINIKIGNINELKEEWGDKWQNGLKGQFSRDHEFRTYSSGKVETIKDDFTITLLSHLPADALEGILAHEYFHAWQAENFLENATLELKEGSAETIAYIFNKDQGHNMWASLQLKNTVTLYKNNLKLGLNLYDELGNMEDFLATLKNMTDWQ